MSLNHILKQDGYNFLKLEYGYGYNVDVDTFHVLIFMLAFQRILLHINKQNSKEPSTKPTDPST